MSNNKIMPKRTVRPDGASVGPVPAQSVRGRLLTDAEMRDAIARGHRMRAHAVARFFSRLGR